MRSKISGMGFSGPSQNSICGSEEVFKAGVRTSKKLTESVSSPAADGLVEALLEREGKLKGLVEQVDWDILREVDEYVLPLGLINPNCQSSALKDFETNLGKEGYSMSKRYSQLLGNTTGDYQLVITKIKLGRGLARFNWLTENKN